MRAPAVRIKCRDTLLSLLLLMGFLSLFGCAKKPDPDELVLIELKKAGSNLSKPHKIDFYLYIPTQTSAEQAAQQVRAAGFQAEVRKAAKGDNWLCLAKKTMVPELVALQKITQDFNALAGSLNGVYDGWETGVEK